MSQRITLEPVFILHRRPYSNTSLILELFSQQYGRIAVLARSARGPKSQFRGVLQLFTPMLASWVGRSELKTLTQVELMRGPYSLTAEFLLCSFYINELIMRLLHRDDPSPHLFQLYQQTLERLASQQHIAITLRRFEKHLLMDLGYGLPLHLDAQTGEPINPQLRYQYIPERGFLRCDNLLDHSLTVSGKSLLALYHENFDEASLIETKRLIRVVLERHLGGKPLKSRDLFDKVGKRKL